MIEDSLMHSSDSCQLDDSCVSSIVEIKHLSCCFSSEAFRFWETFALIMRGQIGESFFLGGVQAATV